MLYYNNLQMLYYNNLHVLYYNNLQIIIICTRNWTVYSFSPIILCMQLDVLFPTINDVTNKIFSIQPIHS